MSMSIELPDPPKDLISCIKFCPHDPTKLLAASWDCTLRLYDVQEQKLLSTIQFRAPLLDACWGEGATAYAAGLERRVYKIDFISEEKQIIGEDHGGAIQNVLYDETTQTVISGSWDYTLQQIDPQSNRSRFVELPGKVYAMDLVSKFLIVALSERQFHLYDVRNLQEPMQRRESSLKYQTRTVRCSPDGDGYASTSIEGRVAVEFFDPSADVQAQKYAFKCHRIVDKVNGIDTVTPVNAIAFHPKYGTFFSGGSDCGICLWDHKAKKRLKQYQKIPYSVMSLDCNAEGTLLAVGASEDSYREDPVDAGNKPATSAIYIRQLEPGEGKSKHS